jgi:ribosomal-protein-alanine N-acetyltransferase
MEFQLRSWKLSDAESLAKHADNPDIASKMTDGFPHPYTFEHAVRFIEKFKDQDPIRLFAIVIQGEAAGGIGIHLQQDIYRFNAELGYWLSADYQRQGIIPRAILQMVDYTFKNFEVNRIFARPFGSNLASRKALEKFAFRLEARFEKSLVKNGNPEDELVYAIRR